ncbi:unnamed protein product [Periconia digitata]|uniref:Uncharacterized protein n=1 Tax=Periconia digitata TaxID=1303443 RepID=A0A9W4U6R5_9PLEO|nr:unnamed protein product [Periconia digitata]
MSSDSPILLLFGSGANTGANVTRVFSAKGYRIAQVSRSASGENTAEKISIAGDFTDYESIPSIFAKVKEQFGGIPSVVVFNASGVTPNDASNPFSLKVEDLNRTLKINTLSAYSAAKEATKGFEQLPADASRTFIYTGNILNMTTIPTMLDLGVGKTGMAHVIESASKAFADKGFKFYYADERLEDGSPLYQGVNGDAHADHFAELVEHKTQGEWLQTFVKGIGYKNFR